MMPLMGGGNPSSNLLMRPINLNQHPTGLPPNLLVMFKARPPVKWFPPAKARKTCKRLTGIGKYLYLFGEKENEEGEEKRESMILGEEKDTDEDASDVDVNDDGEIIEIDEETKRKRKEEKEKFALLPAKTKKKLEKGASQG